MSGDTTALNRKVTKHQVRERSYIKHPDRVHRRITIDNCLGLIIGHRSVNDQGIIAIVDREL